MKWYYAIAFIVGTISWFVSIILDKNIETTIISVFILVSVVGYRVEVLIEKKNKNEN
jgi:hypothetical protein